MQTDTGRDSRPCSAQSYCACVSLRVYKVVAVDLATEAGDRN